jgi:acetyltransferase
MVATGKVGILSQSGALLTALLSREHCAEVGCSAFVSVGSLLDISWAEWLDYLVQDSHTECLVIYVERLGNPCEFFAAAREVAPHKPIVLIKGGVVGEAMIPDEVFEEACRCSGVLRVERFSDLFRMAAHLTSRPLPEGGADAGKVKGNRLAIVTNTRGPAVLAAEALRDDGGSFAVLEPRTVANLAEGLTSAWDQQNPVDVGDHATAERFTRATAIVAHDRNADALLVLLAPVAMIDPKLVALALKDLVRTCGKPVLACWMWGAGSPECLASLRNAGITVCHSPESSVRTFGYLWRHSESLRCLALTATPKREAR